MWRWCTMVVLVMGLAACGGDGKDSSAQVPDVAGDRTTSTSNPSAARAGAPATLEAFCGAVDFGPVAAATEIDDDEPEFRDDHVGTRWNCEWSSSGRTATFSTVDDAGGASDQELRAACAVAQAPDVELLMVGGHRGVACFGGDFISRVVFSVAPGLWVDAYTQGVGDAGKDALVATTSKLAERWPG